LNKKTLSEADICAKFITPALNKAGWSEVEQVFREYTLRPGRVVVQGSHSRRDKKSVLRADYALFYKTGMALAVIEAKDTLTALVGVPRRRRPNPAAPPAPSLPGAPRFCGSTPS
jgi:type I restriction enzyme R subunit